MVKPTRLNKRFNDRIVSPGNINGQVRDCHAKYARLRNGIFAGSWLEHKGAGTGWQWGQQPPPQLFGRPNFFRKVYKKYRPILRFGRLVLLTCWSEIEDGQVWTRVLSIPLWSAVAMFWSPHYPNTDQCVNYPIIHQNVIILKPLKQNPTALNVNPIQ